MPSDTESDAETAPEEPSDETVVQTASDAAEGLIFSRYKQSEVRDYDVTITFEDGVLEVDVYLNAPDEEGGPDPDQVADDAALAARQAVDELFGE
ncbi:hypothetical protein [Halobiforma nitratireducens]|uniref:DUF3194 domain-containing protein n=1 Tax=Halobiforma nitratireducens JCM 10879 TaxID=1227454 RepID=M0LLX0_9EURY|nr:hypothetical protein [Halobiforma nitratireducens]EMA34098.1 hypothetical protein C446_13679 [Halobiforma nitratireducens JCM 10879]